MQPKNSEEGTHHVRVRELNSVKKSDSEIFKYTIVCVSPHVL